MTTAPSSRPMVTIITPIRNEEAYIARCLRSILDNDYPAERMEVIVVDGMSDDATREIVRRLGDEDARIRLLDNPERIVPHAMNRGIDASRGEIIIRIDGHAEIEGDYVSKAVATLEALPDVWSVGGVMETIGTTHTGRVVSAAMTSPIGVGGGNFRVVTTPGYRYAGPFSAQWRWVFDKVGGFDEELVRNQDDEFIQRLIAAGGKMYQTPEIRCRYFARTSFFKLWRQYYQYGFWRIRTIQKHGRAARFRQIVPLLFVLCWILLIVAAVAYRPVGYALVGFAALYAMGLIASIVLAARKHPWSVALLVPLPVAIMHFAYGLGSLKGVWSWVICRGRFVTKGKSHVLSR